MAKFSLVEEDGEGPSNRVPKRQRISVVSRAHPVESEGHEETEEEQEQEEGEEDEEEEEDAEDEEEGESDQEEEEEQECDAGEGAPPSAYVGGARETDAVAVEPTRDGLVSATLTDPEVLDCPICYDSLTIPVFQCENGHIACSNCCSKVRNKCPSCCTPIGYSRCRAIEKVLESVKVACQNRKYGCKESFIYSLKLKHEKLCACTPCWCPMYSCSFMGSLEQLSQHFSCVHKYSALSFRYRRPMVFPSHAADKFHILREENDGALFIINKTPQQSLGTMVTLYRIAPSLMESCYYDLLVKEAGCVLRLQYFAKNFKRREDCTDLSRFLLVPSLFSKPLHMEICIWPPGGSNPQSTKIFTRNSFAV